MAKRAAAAHESLASEREWLAAVVDDLASDEPKLVYADWLDERGDERGPLLRQLVAASDSMSLDDFPVPGKRVSTQWLDLVGFPLLRAIAETRLLEMKAPTLRFARPALRMVAHSASDKKIDVGASKIGGLPDLPAGLAWPQGQECHAIYNDNCEGVERLAGFLAQVNCAEIADTLAGRDLPATGLLSFFCYQDIEDDNPDTIGAKAIYFPDTSSLVRTEPPDELVLGNRLMKPQRLTFEETLDIPVSSDGPWTDEMRPTEGKDYFPMLDQVWQPNFRNMLGYARATSGGDPTPSRSARHLVVLDNSVGCTLHIQIEQPDFAARRFDKIMLRWVDFD
jgi:uncharacterized protein (TIGR02996 family)